MLQGGPGHQTHLPCDEPRHPDDIWRCLRRRGLRRRLRRRLRPRLPRCVFGLRSPGLLFGPAALRFGLRLRLLHPHLSLRSGLRSRLGSGRSRLGLRLRLRSWNDRRVLLFDLNLFFGHLIIGGNLIGSTDEYHRMSTAPCRGSKHRSRHGEGGVVPHRTQASPCRESCPRSGRPCEPSFSSVVTKPFPYTGQTTPYWRRCCTWSCRPTPVAMPWATKATAPTAPATFPAVRTPCLNFAHM